MRAGGMPAVTVNDAQMKQLVAYLSSLGTAQAKESPAADHGTQPAPGQRTAPATSTASSVANTPKEVKVVPLSAEALREKHSLSATAANCHGGRRFEWNRRRSGSGWNGVGTFRLCAGQSVAAPQHPDEE